MKKRIFFLFLFISAAILFCGEQPKKSPVGVDEQLGSQIPMGLQFANEKGEKIPLSSIIDKPTIFMFVYYECPGICTPLMSEVSTQISKLDILPGKDYRLVSVSINPKDTPELAAKKKKNYLDNANISIPANGWHFLTGDSASIFQLTDAVGFRFKKEGEDYIHAGALIVVSPTGKITRYLLGTEFLPFDIKMALIEASEGKATPTIAKMIKFCFRYDSEGKKYVLNVTRIAGSIIILAAMAFAAFLVFSKRNKELINKA